MKYEVFHDMFTPTIRIKSEAENRKTENSLLKHLTVSNVSSDFFKTEQISHSPASFEKALALGSCPAGHTGK